MRKNTIFIPIPRRPKALDRHWRVQSVQIVRVFDRIRREMEDRYDDGSYGEFCWFAREYPRIFRHHVDHAAYRLMTIRRRYARAFKELKAAVERANASGHDLFETSFDNRLSWAIYWDSEAYLAAVNCSLNALARVVGTAYEEQTPLSFNGLCKKGHLAGIVDLLRSAQMDWVGLLKDYRDCFTHYTPVDAVLVVTMRLYANGWETRCCLPTNPNSREILDFRYARRRELLRYALFLFGRS